MLSSQEQEKISELINRAVLGTDTSLSRRRGSSDEPLAIFNAVKIDANGISPSFWLLAEQGKIVLCGHGDTFQEEIHHYYHQLAPSQVPNDETKLKMVDAQGSILVPGYIDIHSHGSWGHSFDESNMSSIHRARNGHLHHGTTRQVLSLVSAPIPSMQKSIRTISNIMKNRNDVLGCHLEGPFISPRKKGAHDLTFLKSPTLRNVQRLTHTDSHAIRQITLAPELDNGIEAIEDISNSGIIPALGHTDADYEKSVEGIQHGSRILTHIYNAMNPLLHRAPGPIAAAVENRQVFIELINDGFHIKNSMVSIAMKLAPHRIAFITDSMAAADCADGLYSLGKSAVTVYNGHAYISGTKTIAGSTLFLDEAVAHAVFDEGIEPKEAVEAATLTPAKALGLDSPNLITHYPLGLIQPGFSCDVLLLNKSDWTVKSVWLEGIPIR